MALSRISRCPNLLNTYNRSLQSVSANYPINGIQSKHHETIPKSRVNGLHVTSARRYPDAPTLSLPNNVSEIFSNEMGRFTPERARDIATPILVYGTHRAASSSNSSNSSSFASFDDKKLAFNGQRNFSIAHEDTHVDSYDCSGAVSLNGSMQSNVPKPFCSTGKSTHFNMPGGQWAKDSKYIAEDMQKSHYRLTSIKPLSSGRVKNGIIYISRMEYSTNVSTSENLQNSDDSKKKEEILKLNKKAALRNLLKDYGKITIIFHVTISLISLGICYVIIISGIDLKHFIEEYLNITNEKMIQTLNTSSGFVLAYSVHKVFAPVRITLTLTFVPLLVRYLRKKGILMPLILKSKPKK